MDNATVDVVVCASLFTHLFEPECTHYLEEIARALKPGGRAVVSIHDQPAAGVLFSGDAARIDIDQDYFFQMAKAAGVPLKKSVGTVYGQQVYLLERPLG